MASLVKRKNGYFYVIYRDNGKQVWHSLGTRDNAEARGQFETLRPSLEHPRRMTLEILLNRILQYARLNYKQSTLNLFNISFTRLIKCLGNKPTRFLTTLDVETYKGYLVKEVTMVTANDYLRSLKTAFNIALRLKLVESNPFEDCRMFRIPKITPAYLQKKEFVKLLHSIDDRRFGLLVSFAALTGMRRGEIVNLRWNDVDMRSRIINIQNSEYFTVKAMRPRTIPMNQDVFNLLLNIPKESDYVFVDEERRPYKAGTVTKKFKRFAAKAGVSDRIHLHSLRHSYASWLVQSSVPLAEVQQLLGHVSVVTTQIYAHLEHENLRAAVETIQLTDSAVDALPE